MRKSMALRASGRFRQTVARRRRRNTRWSPVVRSPRASTHAALSVSWSSEAIRPSVGEADQMNKGGVQFVA